MRTKQRHEGYLLIDHRESPGLPNRSRMFEGSFVSCSHCQATVILNRDRTRERAYCRSCDHYICDTCANVAATTSTPHRSFKQIIDEVLASVEK